MLKTILISLAVFGVLLGVGAAWAKHRGYCNHSDRVQFITQRLTHKLDLTDEQQSGLSALADKFSELRDDAVDRKNSIRDSVIGLLSAPSLDRELAADLLEEGFKSMAERKRELIDAVAEFTDSLQPDQRAQLTELIGDRLAYHWGHHRWAH